MKTNVRSALTLVVTAASLALGIASAHAQTAQTAQTGPWYIGAGGGITKLDADSDFRSAVRAGFGNDFTTDIDDEDTGWKIYAGYRVLPWLAIELAYADYGKAKLDASTTFPSASINTRWEATAISLEAVPTLDFDRFSLFAKLGAAFYRVEADTTTNFTGGTSVSGSAKQDDVAFKWGGGGAFQFTPNFGLRIEYEQFEAGNSSTGKGDVSLLSASLLYRF